MHRTEITDRSDDYRGPLRVIRAAKFVMSIARRAVYISYDLTSHRIAVPSGINFFSTNPSQFCSVLPRMEKIAGATSNNVLTA